MDFGKQEKGEFVRVDDRGVFREMITTRKWEGILYGEMKTGTEMGHHYHKYTVAYFCLISGKVTIRTNNLHTGEIASSALTPGQAYMFRPEEVRVIKFVEGGYYMLAKSHRYDASNPDLIAYLNEF